MITFNELAFSDDLQSLTIDCEVDTATSPNANIKSIYLEYYKNRNASGAPSDKAVKVFQAPVGGAPVDHVRITVTTANMSMHDTGFYSFARGLFYVLVHWEDEGEVPYYDIAAVLDWHYVYELGMRFIAPFAKNCASSRCDVPEDFEQLVLVTHALQFAIAAKDMDMLDILWGRYVNFSATAADVSPCNCR